MKKISLILMKISKNMSILSLSNDIDPCHFSSFGFERDNSYHPIKKGSNSSGSLFFCAIGFLPLFLSFFLSSDAHSQSKLSYLVEPKAGIMHQFQNRVCGHLMLSMWWGGSCFAWICIKISLGVGAWMVCVCVSVFVLVM